MQSHALLKNRLLNRVKVDLERHEIEKAISRLEGFLQRHTTDQTIHNILGELFLLMGNNIKAGRHFFLKQKKTEAEKDAVFQFIKSLGNDPILIAKKLINKHFFEPNYLDDYSKEKYGELIKRSKEKVGKTPKFLQGLERYLGKGNTNY